MKASSESGEWASVIVVRAVSVIIFMLISSDERDVAAIHAVVNGIAFDRLESRVFY